MKKRKVRLVRKRSGRTQYYQIQEKKFFFWRTREMYVDILLDNAMKAFDSYILESSIPDFKVISEGVVYSE